MPKHDASKLVKSENQAFFEEKLSETIKKPKELWESLKSLGLKNKTVIFNFNTIKDIDTLPHDIRSILEDFKNYFLNLKESLLIKF